MAAAAEGSKQGRHAVLPGVPGQPGVVARGEPDPAVGATGERHDVADRGVVVIRDELVVRADGLVEQGVGEDAIRNVGAAADEGEVVLVLEPSWANNLLHVVGAGVLRERAGAKVVDEEPTRARS